MSLATPPGGTFDPGSFRDPASRVFYVDGQVGRALGEAGAADWRALAGSKLFPRWVADGRLIGTEEVTSPTGSPELRHDRVPFWSYPYEWTFSMLADAARLQLDLLDDALAEDLTLKDASPYNIQFVGSRPVFVDIGSFRPLTPGEPWLGYRQFCQLFLYPLMLRAHAGIPFHPRLRGSVSGIAPAEARATLRGRRVFRPGVLADVVLQARADRTATRDVRTELAKAGFNKDMILANVRRLQKVVEKTRWEPDGSTWSDYADCGHVATQRGPKTEYVAAVAGRSRRRLVWDLGANDGHFSRAVAPHADTVVAVDGDELTLDRLYRGLRTDGPDNVLPLVMDLADPSPGLGWRGLERRRLEERGRPDLVLMLAVVHHLVIGANLPLTEVIDWLATLGAETVFEWVPPEDPMARTLAVNKREGEVHADYREEALRDLLRARFEVLDETPLEGRILFHIRPLG